MLLIIGFACDGGLWNAVYNAAATFPVTTGNNVGNRRISGQNVSLSCFLVRCPVEAREVSTLSRRVCRRRTGVSHNPYAPLCTALIYPRPGEHFLNPYAPRRAAELAAAAL